MKITEPSGRRQPGRGKARRLGGSLAAGAVVAGILVAWEGLHNHAALAVGGGRPAAEGRARDGRVHPRDRGHLHVPGRGRGGVRGRHGAGAPPQRPASSAPVSPGGTAPPQSRVRAVVADDRHRRETGPGTGQPRRHLGRARARHGLTVLAVMNGIRVPRLEIVLSVLATWALLALLAVVAVGLLRRHHRAIGRHGVAVRQARGDRHRPGRPSRRPGRRRQVTSVAQAGPRRAAGQVGRTRQRAAHVPPARPAQPAPAPRGRNLRRGQAWKKTGEDPAGGRRRAGHEGGEPGPDSPTWSWGPAGQPVRLAGGQPGGGGELGAAHRAAAASRTWSPSTRPAAAPARRSPPTSTASHLSHQRKEPAMPAQQAASRPSTGPGAPPPGPAAACPPSGGR